MGSLNRWAQGEPVQEWAERQLSLGLEEAIEMALSAVDMETNPHVLSQEVYEDIASKLGDEEEAALAAALLEADILVVGEDPDLLIAPVEETNPAMLVEEVINLLEIEKSPQEAYLMASKLSLEGRRRVARYLNLTTKVQMVLGHASGCIVELLRDTSRRMNASNNPYEDSETRNAGMIRIGENIQWSLGALLNDLKKVRCGAKGIRELFVGGADDLATALLTRIEELEEITKIQCSDGNWDADEYMFGLANGLLLALAILRDEEPKLLDKPVEWVEETLSRHYDVQDGSSTDDQLDFDRYDTLTMIEP